MKKVISLVLTLALVLSALTVMIVPAVADETPAQNTKITENQGLEPDDAKVFHINTAADLWRIMNSWFRSTKYGNYKGYTIQLEADIDLNPGWSYTDAARPLNVWIPIYNFQGVFDGQGHTIKGLYTEGDDQTTKPDQYANNGANAAFIATLVDGTIKNVVFDNAKFVCGYKLVADGNTYRATAEQSNNAGIVACVKGNGVIDGVIVKNTKIEAGKKAGGILAYQFSSDATKCNAVIKNCLVGENVSVSAYESVGGLVGATAEYPVTISDCASYANVTAYSGTGSETACAGGLVGRAQAKLTVTRSFFGGTVTAPEGKAAALVYLVDYPDDGAQPITLTDVYSVTTTLPAFVKGKINPLNDEDIKIARYFGTPGEYVNEGVAYAFKWEFTYEGDSQPTTVFYNLTDALKSVYPTAGYVYTNPNAMRTATVNDPFTVADGDALLALDAFKVATGKLTWKKQESSGLVMNLATWEVMEGHAWGEGVVTAPKCTTKGFTTYTCANCGTTKIDNYVDALGHQTAEEWTVEVAPVAGDDGHVGKQVKKCTREGCGAVVSAQLLAKDGTPVDMTVYQPTPDWKANAQGVFEIGSASDLLAFINNRVANGSYKDKTVVLTADIDLNPEWEVSFVELGILPANTYAIMNNFQGTLDGQGHTIKGLYQKATAANTFAGFIQMLGNSATTPCTIKNIKFDKCYFENTWDANNSACALFAYVRADGCVIENVISNAVCVGTKNVGGIIGRIQGTSTDKRDGLTVKNCVFTGSVKGITGVGGIMGSTDASVVANVAMANAKFINCVNYGTVEATTKQGGGIVGIARGAGFTMTGCVNAGTVTAATVGGLLFTYNTNGTDGTTVTATNCYAITTAENPVLYDKGNKELTGEAFVMTNVEAIASADAVLALDAFKGSETSEKWYKTKDGTMIMPMGVKEINDGHTFGEGVVTPATCQATGFTTYTCTICGYSYTDNVTEKAAHTPAAEWTVASEPTYTRSGSKYKLCTVCHEVAETEIIPKLERETEAPTEAPTQPATPEKKGCGSTVAFSAVIVTLTATLGTCIIRKKH